MTARAITLTISMLVLAGLLVLTRQAGAEDAPVYLLSWGSQGTGPGQFLGPAGIGLDASGNVYVADAGNFRVEVFAPNGTLIHELPMPVDSVGQPAACRDVAVDAAGNIYVTDLLHQLILVFNDSLQLVNQWSTTIDEGPEALAIDPSGQLLYVRNDWGDLVTFTLGGLQVGKWWIGSFIPFSSGFGVSPDGTLYFPYGAVRVRRFSSTGQVRSTFGDIVGHGPGSFIGVEGVAVSPDSSVFVTDADARVEKFTADGVFLLEWGSRGNGPGQLSTSLPDLVVDTNNYIYVLDAGNYRVVKYGPSQTPTLKKSWGSLKRHFR